nr:MAG TPA: hypothetical protein [Caudoviricetes sp.]
MNNFCFPLFSYRHTLRASHPLIKFLAADLFSQNLHTPQFFQPPVPVAHLRSFSSLLFLFSFRGIIMLPHILYERRCFIMFGTLDFLNYIDPVARYNIKTTTDSFENVSIHDSEIKDNFLPIYFQNKKVFINIYQIVYIVQSK